MHIFKMQNQITYQTLWWVLWGWDCGSLSCAVWSYRRLTLSANDWAPLKPPWVASSAKRAKEGVGYAGHSHQGSEVINMRGHIVNWDPVGIGPQHLRQENMSTPKTNDLSRQVSLLLPPAPWPSGRPRAPPFSLASPSVQGRPLLNPP